jgi:hypothetical protein
MTDYSEQELEMMKKYKDVADNVRESTLALYTSMVNNIR